MEKRKWLKYVLIILVILITGLFYSCNSIKDKDIKLELQSQEDSEYTLGDDEEESSIQGDVESGSADKINAGSTIKSSTIESSMPESNTIEEYNNQNSYEPQNPESSIEELNIIFVHICGEVNNPDVYEVREDARLIDVIKLAGGLTKDAAGDFVNQASKISDGQQIYIPSKSETKDKTPAEYSVLAENDAINTGTGSQQNNTTTNSNSVGNGNEESTQGKVNLNTASRDELMTLTGIGEAKADSIISYREEHGGFKTIEEIKNIKGIKDSVFNKISDEITVN